MLRMLLFDHFDDFLIFLGNYSAKGACIMNGCLKIKQKQAVRLQK